MVTVELKGLHIVRSKGKVYYYAWRGGPRIEGAPGTPAFMAAYNRALADHRAPDTDKFRSIVISYKSSDHFKKLAETTKRNWNRWLDIIESYFGDLRTVQFDRPEKIRPVIRKWRSTYADRPRSADYGMQVLSRVLSHAVDPLGKIASNPCEGIKHLYTGSRAEIIWTENDIQALRNSKKASAEVMWAVDLAAHTGLRVSDLIRLSWSHIGEDAIVITTGKSRHKREAIVPLYDDLRNLLARIPKQSTAVLTNSRKKPWTADGLNSSFTAAMKHEECALKDRDLHFHDLRGTAATKFYIAGLSERVIAEIMAWEEEQVAKIIRRYVSRGAATKAVIHQLDAARQGRADLRDKVDGYFLSAEMERIAVAAMAAGGAVYFIRGEVSGRIKIGRAINAVGRIMELSIGSSEKLELVAVIQGGQADEKYLHRWFASCRVKGEWFEPNTILTELIDVLATTPDLDWRKWLTIRNHANVVPLERK